MINRHRIVGGLAGLLTLGALGGLTTGAMPQLAAADAQPGDHLTSEVLLSAADLDAAGWQKPMTGDIVSDDGALLGQCAGPTPDLAPGFVELKGTDLYSNADDISATGLELVMSFKTDAQARDYVSSYRTAIEGRCLDLFGLKKWHVTRSAKVTLRRSDAEHARTWTVRDSVAHQQTDSVSLVRVQERVALIWLTGYPTDPAKTLHLHRLTQTAADRIAV